MKKIILGFLILFIASFVSGFLYIHTNDMRVYLIIGIVMIIVGVYVWRDLIKTAIKKA